jgi:hypothetical protein
MSNNFGAVLRLSHALLQILQSPVAFLTLLLHFSAGSAFQLLILQLAERLEPMKSLSEVKEEVHVAVNT